jgi:hypothetical protein
MRRLLLLLMLVGLAGLTEASPLQSVPARQIELEPGRSFRETHVFKGGQRASVIAIGREGASNLGLYIYDEHGSCVTWDDVGSLSTKDDTAVEWYPIRDSAYTLEVRNLGLAPNRLDLVVR